MTERTSAAVEQTDDHFVCGPSSLGWDGTALTINIDEVTVPIPSRLRGKVRLIPKAITDTRVHLDADGLHRWWPISPLADVEVDLQSPGRQWRGHGYFDSNWGDVPLETSFATWHWSRARTPSGAQIFYDVNRRRGPAPSLAVALAFAPDGSVQEIPSPPLAQLPKTFWGIERATRSDGGSGARVIDTLENAPFYARSHIESVLDGAPVQAIHESLDLDRFVSPVVQMMLPFKMPRRF